MKNSLRVLTIPPAPNGSQMLQEAGLLRDYWYAAAQAKDVTDKQPLARTIMGEMLVLWRNSAGQAVTMRDRCLHRNAPLSAGDLFDGKIGCPYHGWTYDDSGQCVSVPSEGANGACPKLNKALRVYPTREQDGLVWVWMGEGEPDKEPFRMPYWQAPGWTAYYMETPFNNAVTNLVENFMDVPHTVWVHKGWFRNRSRKRVGAKVERTEDSVLVTYDQPSDSIGFTDRILNPNGLSLVHTDKFYMPNNTRVDYIWGNDERSFVITSTSTPVSPTSCLVFTLIGYRFGRLDKLVKLGLPWYTRKVIEQDVDIMEVQGRTLRHYGANEFESTPADTLHVFIESLRDYAASGGTLPKPAPTVENIEFWI